MYSRKIDYRVTNSNRPSIIWVSFLQTNIGKSHRKEYAHLYTNNEDKTWTPILEITRQFKILSDTSHKYCEDNILYDQQQQKLSTVAKVTLNEVVVDLPSSSREHMHYVARSRVRNSSKLHILNLHEKKSALVRRLKRCQIERKTFSILCTMLIQQ